MAGTRLRRLGRSQALRPVLLPHRAVITARVVGPSIVVVYTDMMKAGAAVGGIVTTKETGGAGAVAGVIIILIVVELGTLIARRRRCSFQARALLSESHPMCPLGLAIQTLKPGPSVNSEHPDPGRPS
jgi:hypothetical protein